MDWFIANKAIADPESNAIIFKNRKIYCETKNDMDDELGIYLTELDLREYNDDDIDFYDFPLDIPEDKLEFNIEKEMLSGSQLLELEKFLYKNENSFARCMQDLKVPCKISQHEITITTSKPIRVPQYRKSIEENNIINEEVKKLLDANIIRQSNSPWSFPTLLVPKPNNKKRLCIDYRKLNAITETDPFPLPRIDDIFDKLNGSVIFSKIDQSSSYYQILMQPRSIALTAFSTPNGHYEFLRLPFGLKNAPSEFSRIMYQILGDLPFIEIYIDDIFVHSKSISDHFEHLKELFSRLKRANLKLNPEKCEFCRTSVKILGHIISKNKISMDPEKSKK